MRKALSTLAMILFLTLPSCSKSTETEDERLLSIEDRIVDFAKGESKEFTKADGYSNPYPFHCMWTKEAINIVDGKLEITLHEKDKTIYSGEYRSKRCEFHYGTYETRMKVARCPGTISSFFTYTNRPVWDEIDIEFLGRNFNQVQFNYYTNGVGGHEYVYDLGFDATEDFHTYAFSWQEDYIAWYVDGKFIYRADKDIPSHPQQIMMNLWNCIGHDEWSGTFDSSLLPVQAKYEYIAYRKA